jgi:hypothetical protein
MPFTTYAEDVRARLLYLRDFMEAINADGVSTIQALREHRNDLPHDLARKLPSLDLSAYSTLWEKEIVRSSS